MEMKTYTRRDSCTAILRKMGIKPQEYNFFIDVAGDKFTCRTDKAASHLEQLREQTLATANKRMNDAAKADHAAKPARVKRTKGVHKESISGVARELISVGRTNEEVWGALKARFGLDDSKKHYPAWYRAEMVRAGALPRQEKKK